DRILEAEGDTCNRYRVSKQADVLMLFFLLSADELAGLLEGLELPYDPGLIPRTVRYYLERTCHGSTLSSVVHAWVLSRTDRAASWRFFREALRSDIDDSQGGTTAEGIHLGAMAGTVDLLTRCYTGLELRDGALHLSPLTPAALPALSFELRYRDHRGERPGVGAAVRGPAVPGRAQGPPGHRGPAHLVRAAAALTARVPSAARRASARSRLAPAPDRRPRPPPGGERTRHRSGRSPARRSGPPSASAPASRSAPGRGARAGGPGRGALPRRSRAGVTFGPPRPGARLCPPPAGGG